MPDNEPIGDYSIRHIELIPFDVMLKHKPSFSIQKRQLEGAEYLEYIFHSQIYGRTLEEMTHKYPENWIEALKERWLPYRLRKYWPIKYRFIKAITSVVFPEWVPPTNLGKPAYLAVVDWKCGLFDGKSGHP